MSVRPSADLRAPGIYQTFDPVVPPALTIADTRITGFVGISQKGPLNEPVRLSNFDEFSEIFGHTDQSYLSDSVYGFFRNGGKTCWVVRVAHTIAAAKQVDAGDLTGPQEFAACAHQIHLDHWKKPTLRIRALNEGSWGNAIWFQCTQSVGATALLTRDMEIGAGEALVSSTRGFETGALVRIYNREGEDFVVLSSVSDKLIKWDTSTPVNRRHKAAAPTHLEVIVFDLHVALRDRREVFKGLQMDPRSRMYAPTVVEQRSRLIRLENLNSSSPVPHNRPAVNALTRLASGADGIELMTPEDFIGHDTGPGERTGMMALAANEEVGLLACPDAMLFYNRNQGPSGELRAQRVQDQMISICELQKDRFAILDIPQSKDIDWVRRWRRRTDSSFASYYWPWLQVVGVGDVTRVVPPSGFMAGIYALCDEREGVHRAPANTEAVGAVDLSVRVTEDHIGILNSESINTFRIQRGVRPWGARTTSSDPQWRYISVRRLFIMLRRSLEAGFSWISFEPNDSRTWDQVRNRTEAFLAELQGKGMLVGGNADQAFIVKCDGELNSPEFVDNGILNCEISVAPVSPAEFITISLVQTMSGPQGG